MTGRAACHDVIDRLTDYLEGALSPAAMQGLEDHVESCEDCRRHVRQFLRVVRSLGALPPEPVPGELQEALLRVLRSRQSA